MNKFVGTQETIIRIIPTLSLNKKTWLNKSHSYSNENSSKGKHVLWSKRVSPNTPTEISKINAHTLNIGLYTKKSDH